MDNGWYRMLRNPKVSSSPTRSPRSARDRVVTADGSEYEADVLVHRHRLRRAALPHRVRGDGPRRPVARARCGTTTTPAPTSALAVPGFPNLFCLYGPNTQPGHGGSLIFVDRDADALHHRPAPHDGHRRTSARVEVRQDVHDAYNARRRRGPRETWSGPTRACPPTTATTRAGWWSTTPSATSTSLNQPRVWTWTTTSSSRLPFEHE